MGNVIDFPNKEETVLISENSLETLDRKDIEVVDVLAGAAHLKSVVVIGYDFEDDLYIASSSSIPSKTLWLLEKGKQVVLDID